MERVKYWRIERIVKLSGKGFALWVGDLDSWKIGHFTREIRTRQGFLVY